MKKHSRDTSIEKTKKLDTETASNLKTVKGKTKKIQAIDEKKIIVKENDVKQQVMIVFLYLGIFHILNIFVYQWFKSVDAIGNVFLTNLSDAMSNSIQFSNLFTLSYLTDVIKNGNWTRFIVGCFFGVVAIVGMVLWKTYKDSNKKMYREGKEYGSAQKGDIAKEALPLNSKYNPDPSKRLDEANMILSKNIQIDMDTRHTMLGNNNVFVTGGSGSGKTRYFVKPNILQMYCNYVVIDPKGSVIEETGHAFEEKGYEVRYLNLVDMSKSMGWNPFAYFRKPEDVQDFVKNLISNTENKNAGGDQFWVKSEQAWLTAIIFYIMATCEGTDKCNMNTVMLMFDNSNAKEDDDEFESVVDKMFKQLEQELKVRNRGRSCYSYGDLAVRNYHIFKVAAGKTAKSILVSIGVRLQDFTLPELKKIMAKDELHLDHLGNPMVKSKNVEKAKYLKFDIDRKTYEITKPNEDYEKLPQERLRKMILFIIISDSEDNFSYLSSIILQQLYKQLYTIADARKDSRLPIHTRFINDEFATCGKQPDYQRKINTMRSREISTCIIVQGISQIKIKELYGESWESIYGACPITLFLGSTKEDSTLDPVKNLAGKATITHKTTSTSKGTQTSVTMGEQIIQADLYDKSDLLRLPLNHCLIHIMGYHVFEDEKYDVKDHKNVELTCDGQENGMANFLDIEDLRTRVKQIDESREKSRREDIRISTVDPDIEDDAGLDFDVYQNLQEGNLLAYGEDVFEFKDEYFFDDYLNVMVQVDIDNEGELDEDMLSLPSF